MNRSRFFICLLLVSFMVSVSAQNKPLTLDDLIPGGKNYYRYVPKNINQLQWLGDEYIYQKGDSLWAVAPSKPDRQRVLLSLDQLNSAMEENGLKRMGTMPSVGTFRDENGIDYLRFYASSSLICYRPDENKITDVVSYEKGDADHDFSTRARALAVTNGKALFVIDREGRRCVASDQDPNISFGAHGVHRNEFGISKGTFWSPTGHALAFYRMDETPVETYPLVDISARQAKMKAIKYPMAGMRSHLVTVGVYFMESGRVVYLKTGPSKEQYQTNISWSPDGSEIYIAELNRRQDTCRLKAYDSHTGDLNRIVLTETHEKYVEPEHPLYFIHNDADRFIWQSERDGYNHLYLYAKDGRLLRQLTRGEWMVTDILGTDARGKTLYYQSTEASPLESNTYALDLKSGKTRRLTVDPGVHRTQLNASRTYMIDHYSNHEVPRNIDIVQLKDLKTERLLSASDPFKNRKMPKTVSGTIKAADGVTDLYYRLTTPVDFDSTKRYPAIVYVYGGPHAQLVTDSWRWAVGGWDTYMAQQGYVLFTIDSRGSDKRGLAFENVTYGRLGEEEMKDQVKGVEWLLSHPYVDADRIGVCGWSFGGFMTTNLILTYPDLFKVGVAGGPVIDWKYYEIMYGERYMGHPKDNLKGYAGSNLLNKVGNLKGHLLLIHGDQDPVVVWQHSLAFLKQCVKERVYPDYYVYPGHEHNVLGPDRVHLQEKITRYFNDYLK